MPKVPQVNIKEIFTKQTGRKLIEQKTVIVCGQWKYEAKKPTVIAGNLSNK